MSIRKKAAKEKRCHWNTEKIKAKREKDIYREEDIYDSNEMFCKRTILGKIFQVYWGRNTCDSLTLRDSRQRRRILCAVMSLWMKKNRELDSWKKAETRVGETK